MPHESEEAASAATQRRTTARRRRWKDATHPHPRTLLGLGPVTYADAQANYKFAIAMESVDSHPTEKVSEKFFNAMWANTVPILLTRRWYDPILPSNHSAVFLEDFGGDVRRLGAHLRMLDQNDAEYRKYFAWKAEGAAPGWVQTMLTGSVFAACHICDEMQYAWAQKRRGTAPDPDWLAEWRGR